MSSELRMPVCHESLRPLFERAFQEGRIAAPGQVAARLSAVEDVWRRERGLQGKRAATAGQLKDLIRSYCETSGVDELEARARRIEGEIAVEITERRAATA